MQLNGGRHRRSTKRTSRDVGASSLKGRIPEELPIKIRIQFVQDKFLIFFKTFTFFYYVMAQNDKKLNNLALFHKIANNVITPAEGINIQNRNSNVLV